MISITSKDFKIIKDIKTIYSNFIIMKLVPDAIGGIYLSSHIRFFQIICITNI